MSSKAIIRAEMQLDDRGFQKNAQRVSRKTKEMGKDFETMGKKAQSSFAGAGRAMLKAFSAVAIVQGMRRSSQEIQEIDRLARQLKITAEELQGIGFIAEQNHSDVNTYANALTRMNRKLGGTENEVKVTSEALAALGINAKEFRDLGMVEQLARLSDGFRANGKGVQSYRHLFALMEDDAKKIAVAFDNTGSAIRRLGKDGIVYTAREIRMFNDQADKMARSMKAIDSLLGTLTTSLGHVATGANLAFDAMKLFSGLGEASDFMQKGLGLMYEIPAPVNPLTELDNDGKNLNNTLAESLMLMRELTSGRSAVEIALGQGAAGAPANPTISSAPKARDLLEKKISDQLEEMEKQTALLEDIADEEGDIGI